MKYQPVIGLEVHVELATASKMFCTCSADYFGKKPNSHVCSVCLGLPGALPTANKKALEWCVVIGLALNCEIPMFSKFDRKNYFYPDLSKGYQISQYDMPFCINGKVTLKNGKKITIQRAHMEEDTAKLTHATVDGIKVSLVDFNRSGVPLVEIVTAPDFENSEEVVEYLKDLQQIIRYLGVSAADMEKGDMRLEPNVSLKKSGSKNLPSYKVELKNINSFKFAQNAIEYEIKRQAEILDSGKTPHQETRGWSETNQSTVSQRSKEEAHDYRYFPEPDIPPINWTKGQIKKLKEKIPELPEAKLKRFQKDYAIPWQDAQQLTRNKEVADFFEKTVKVGEKHNIIPSTIANLMINRKVDISKTLPAKLVKNILNMPRAQTLKNEDLQRVIEKILSENVKAVGDYRKGKTAAIMFLIGQVQKEMKGLGDHGKIKKFLAERLK